MKMLLLALASFILLPLKARAGNPPVNVCDPTFGLCMRVNADGSLPTSPTTPSYTVLPAASAVSGPLTLTQSGSYVWDSRGTYAGALETLKQAGADGSLVTVASKSSPGATCVVLTTPQGSTAPNTQDQLSGATGTTSLTSTLTTAPEGCAGSGPSNVTVASSTSANPVVSFQQTATTAAAAMPSNSLANGLIFTAKASNTGLICVGTPNVTLGAGYCLSAGQSGSAGVANSNQLYMIGSNATDVLQALGN